MIIIFKGQANEVVLTLTEKASLSSPYYLFEFQNDSDKTVQRFIAEDVSSFTDRYNRFAITEKSNPDNLSGEVELSLPGFWSYTIREQTSSTNLDPDQSGEIVETGRVRVIGVSTTSYKYDSMTKTNKVYNG